MAVSRKPAEPKIKPQPGPQTAFLECDADIAIYGGAAGGGKTYALLIDALRLRNVPRGRAVIFRRTTKQLKKAGSVWDTAMELYTQFKGVTYRTTEMDFQFPGGGYISLNHMELESNRYDWQGSQVDFIGYDELTQFYETQFWYLVSRMRGSSGIKPWLRATCNPIPIDDPVGGWVNRLIEWYYDHDTGYAIPERSGVIRWFYRVDAVDDDGKDEIKWYDSKEEAMEANPIMAAIGEPKSFTFICSKLDDNPALLKQNPGYKANLMSMEKVEREQLLMGNWVIRKDMQGVIYHLPSENIFDDNHPEYSRLKESLYWSAPIIGGWDFGSGESLLCCILGLLDLKHNDRLWIDNCFPWEQTSWRVASDDVKEWTAERYFDEYGRRQGANLHFGDPAGASKESDQSSWIANLRRGGIPLFRLPPQINTRQEIEWGFKRVQLMINDDRLMIHKRCDYLIRCMRNWRRNIPDGVQIDFISKKYIEPRADVWSHGGMALMYQIVGMMMYLKSLRKGNKEIRRTKELPGREAPGEPSVDAPRLGTGSLSKLLPGRVSTPAGRSFPNPRSLV